MEKPCTKLEMGINEDIGEAIHNQIWKLHDDMHNCVNMREFRNEDDRNKILAWNDKIYRKNAKKLKKEMSDYIDNETKLFSNITRHFKAYKYSARPRNEKSFDEIEENKHKQLLLKIWLIISNFALAIFFISEIIQIIPLSL